MKRKLLLSIAVFTAMFNANAESGYNFGIIQSGSNPEIYDHFIEIERADITMKRHESLLSVEVDKNKKLTSEIGLLQSRIESMVGSIGSLSASNHLLHSQNKDFMNEKNLMVSEQEYLNKQLDSSAEALEDAKELIKRLNDRYAARADEFSEIREKKESLNMELIKANGLLSTSEEALNLANEEMFNLKENITSFEDTIAKNKKEISKLSGVIQDLESNLLSKEKELTKSDATIKKVAIEANLMASSYDDKLTEANITINSLKANIDKTRIMNSEIINDMVGDAKQSLKETEKQNKEKIINLTETVSKLKNKISLKDRELAESKATVKEVATMGNLMAEDYESKAAVNKSELLEANKTVKSLTLELAESKATIKEVATMGNLMAKDYESKAAHKEEVSEVDKNSINKVIEFLSRKLDELVHEGKPAVEDDDVKFGPRIEIIDDDYSYRSDPITIDLSTDYKYDLNLYASRSEEEYMDYYGNRKFDYSLIY